MMKEIKLTKGFVTIIDDEDHRVVSGYSWVVNEKSHGAYAYAYVKGSYAEGKTKRIYLHRLILKAPKGLDVDHVNGDTLDNRKSNLRLATRRQNLINSKKRNGTASKYKGISWKSRDKRWVSKITVKGKPLVLGNFFKHEEILAAKAYDSAARKYFGEFAKTNFKGGG